MRYKKLLSSIISVTAVCAVLVSALSFSASAAEIDEEELISAPQAVLDSVSEGNTESSSLPSTYSSVDLGYVSSIKEQLYNDCWVYGALGTLESTLLKNDLYIGDMSVNHANIWGSTRSSGKGWVRRTGEAGRAKIMLGYLTSWQGAVLDSKLPGLELTDFTPDELPTGLADFGVTSIKYLYREDADSIKQAIMESGGISTYYSNSVNCFNYDTYSFYMSPDYADSYMGHAIEIVGWDDNYPKESFKRTPRDNGAWLIKNSWGTGDNIEGYFWMSYYDKYLFSEIFEPAFTFSEVMTLDESVSLNQNEIYGATYEFDENYSAENELTFINVLDADTEHSMIDRVTFESKCIGGSYTIYCLPVSDGVPDGDLEHGTVLAEGVIDYEGYHCADVADFVPEGGKYAIAVRITAPEGKAASVGIGEWLTNNDSSVEEPNYVFVNESENGQSFIIENGAVTDLLDRYREDGDELGATFVIKTVNIREYLRADVNNDGKVDITDATTVQKYAAKLTELDYSQKKAADVDHDGKINISDVTDIQKIIARLIK